MGRGIHHAFPMLRRLAFPGGHASYDTIGFMSMQRNSHQVYELGYHIIFCTKYRHKILTGEVEIACRNAMAETCAAYGWTLGR